MNGQTLDSLAPLLYAVRRIEQRRYVAGLTAPSIRTASHLLLAVDSGRGSLLVGQSRSPLTEGGGCLLPPGVQALVEPSDTGALDLYEISFVSLETGRTSADSCEPADARPFPHVGELKPTPDGAFLRRVRSLSQLFSSGAQMDRLRAHIVFQELLLLLLAGQHEPDAASGLSSVQAVEQSLACLRERFADDWTVERLAGIAQLGRWQYGRIFKELTGMTPIEYLTKLRMDRAKRLLLQSAGGLKEIAREVGYGDEHYFQRRFKQTVGLAPMQYVRQTRVDPKVISLQYAGALLALGLKPVGVDQAKLRLFHEQLTDVPGLSDELNEWDTISSLRPDLVIAPDYVPPDTMRKLEQITAAVTVPWMDRDVFGHVDTIGDLLDRRKEARQWRSRYEAKAQRARELCRTLVGRGETAAILRIRKKGLYLYFNRDIGHTIYGVMGFAPPSEVRRSWESRRHKAAKVITPDMLPLYEADRLFILVDDNGNERFGQLTESAAWRSYPAVREGRVIFLSGRWASYDPVNLEWELEEGLRLLGCRRTIDL